MKKKKHREAQLMRLSPSNDLLMLLFSTGDISPTLALLQGSSPINEAPYSPNFDERMTYHHHDTNVPFSPLLPSFEKFILGHCRSL